MYFHYFLYIQNVEQTSIWPIQNRKHHIWSHTTIVEKYSDNVFISTCLNNRVYNRRHYGEKFVHTHTHTRAHLNNVCVFIYESMYIHMYIKHQWSVITQKTPGKRPPRSAFDRRTKQALRGGGGGMGRTQRGRVWEERDINKDLLPSSSHLRTTVLPYLALLSGTLNLFDQRSIRSSYLYFAHMIIIWFIIFRNENWRIMNLCFMILFTNIDFESCPNWWVKMYMCMSSKRFMLWAAHGLIVGWQKWIYFSMWKKFKFNWKVR